MSEPWTFTGEIARVGQAHGVVTLVEGSSFCLSSEGGDVVADSPHGLFFLDTRFISRFELRIDGRRAEGLGVAVDDPFAGTFFCRSHPQPGRADTGLVVFRRRWVGRGMREEIELVNHASEERHTLLELIVATDFADLFEVKEDRVRHSGAYSSEMEPDFLRYGNRRNGRDKEVTLYFSEPADVDAGKAAWHVRLGPGESWSVCIGVSATVDGKPIEPRYKCGQPVEQATPARRLTTWRENVPEIDSDNGVLSGAVRRSVEDLGALRIFDPEHPDLPVVAAGAPWFMTLFGRDSLLTSWMALTIDPELARGVVETLARLQGTKEDTETEEEPGKILHEVRFGTTGSLSLGGGDIYYGTVDATPLFVMLLGELRRWGLADEVVERLLPHADAALQWIAEYGDADGDGYVEYQRKTERGLANQGWKDSWDGIRFADGTIAQAPIALCEVQGYVYAAYVARAHFASEAGDDATFDRYRKMAADLKESFNRDFWLPDRGWFAVGLDRDKQPIDSLASNMGHCLWTGIIDEDKAGAVAEHLVSPDMFSGWGVRTLAKSMVGYNPVSYHCGSVWPHDNALAVSGLMRYGYVEEAQQIIEALLAVSAAHGGRLPELFAGLGRDELSVPASYPTSCVPQAWAAATPLLFIRSMVRLDPWIPRRRLWLSPVLPPSVSRLRVEGIPLCGGRVTVEVDGDDVSIEGLPDDIEVFRGARRPLTASGQAD